MSDVPNHNEIAELVESLCQGELTAEQAARLETLLCTDKSARRYYIRYLHMHASLRLFSGCGAESQESARLREFMQYQGSGVDPDAQESRPSGASLEESKTVGAQALGFLSECFQQGASFLSKPMILSLFLAIGLPGILFLILVLHVARQPAPAVPVAQVTETHECVWDADTMPLSTGADLFAGTQLQLTQGLVELAFANGAKVLFQGPATFDTLNSDAGFLHAGNLVARVPKEARGFTVRMPDAAVVDLGTEFGVSVDEHGRNEEVHVFRGEVVLETGPSAGGREPSRRHLRAGSAASIRLAGGSHEPIVRKIAFRADRYVRRLPRSTSSPQPAIVADFSGGEGKSAVDQYPGIPGLGWATGWASHKIRGFACRATIERDDPLLNGGDYLRVLIERKSGTGLFDQTIERKLDLDGPVDLRQPYVVSFSVRIDSLSRFDDLGDLLNFHNSIMSRIKGSQLRLASGWHIRMGTYKGQSVKPRNWAFISSDGKRETKRVDSGIPVREGEIYSFRVFVDPTARRWVPSIAVGGGEWKRFGPIGMRSADTAEQCHYWPYLCLTWYMAGGNKGEEIERLGFSVDSIRITAAPEGHENKN